MFLPLLSVVSLKEWVLLMNFIRWYHSQTQLAVSVVIYYFLLFPFVLVRRLSYLFWQHLIFITLQALFLLFGQFVSFPLVSSLALLNYSLVVLLKVSKSLFVYSCPTSFSDDDVQGVLIVPNLCTAYQIMSNFFFLQLCQFLSINLSQMSQI